MNRYLLPRLRHSLFLVRNYFFALLMILTLIVTMTATRAAESHEVLPIISKAVAAYQAEQQKAAEAPSEHSSQEAPLEILPLTLQSQSETEITTPNDHTADAIPNNSVAVNDGNSGENMPNPLKIPIVLYSPLVFSYWEQLQAEQVMPPKLTAQEIVNNEFLHDAITDLISQHETSIDSTIELLSLATSITVISNDSENNVISNENMSNANVTTSFNSPYLKLLSHAFEKNGVPDASIDTIANQETISTEPQIEPSNLPPHQNDLTDKETSNNGNLITKTNSNEDVVVERNDEPINNYLLYALFPHHKKNVIEAPLSKSYKENHDTSEDHESDLSIMKLADKIDRSLSFNEELNDEAFEGSVDEDASLEAELAEGYFDSYQDYQQHYKTLDEDEVLSLESQTYPYVQDPQLEEALSSAEFEDLSTHQQIEQLLTTGDYYILSDDVIKGRQYYIQAVRIGAKDKNSPLYAKALVKLADLEENPYLARFQYTNALDIYETHVGFDMEIADILVKLVWTFDVTTERIVIYELLTNAKQILEKYTYSPQYTMVLRNLAIYYEAVDDFENADSNYQAALALDLEHLTTNDIRTILALENYAAFYLKFREYQKAEDILLFKLKAHEEAETTDYYNLGRTQSMLGWTYLQQQNLDDALHYYNAALGNINYSITKNRFMPHYYSLPAIFDLIYFFNVTEDPERGIPYFEVARALLSSEDEESVLDYLKKTPKEMIDLGRIVNYPWAATAEVEGLITMMNYIDNKE